MTSPINGGGGYSPIEKKEFQQEFKEGFNLFKESLNVYQASDNPNQKEALKNVMQQAVNVMNETASIILSKHAQKKEMDLNQDFQSFVKEPDDFHIQALKKDIENLEKNL